MALNRTNTGILCAPLEGAKNIISFDPFVSRYEPKDTVECSQSNRIMVRNWDSLIGRKFGLKDQVTALLMDDAVAPIAAQCFGEFTAFKVPWQFHAYASTSSRTKCSRRVVGSFSG